MNIPNFLQEKFVDEEGYLTPGWALVIQQLFTELQINAGQEGLVPPSLSTTDIALVAGSPNLQNGTFIYDTVKKRLLTNIEGTFKGVVTEPV